MQTIIVAANVHQRLLLAAALIHGFPTPLSTLPATPVSTITEFDEKPRAGGEVLIPS